MISQFFWGPLSLKGEKSAHCQMLSQIHIASLDETEIFALAYETAEAVNIHFYLLSKLFMSICLLYAENTQELEQVRSLNIATNMNKQGLWVTRLLHTFWMHMLIKMFLVDIQACGTIKNWICTYAKNTITSHQIMLHFLTMLAAWLFALPHILKYGNNYWMDCDEISTDIHGSSKLILNDKGRHTKTPTIHNEWVRWRISVLRVVNVKGPLYRHWISVWGQEGLPWWRSVFSECFSSLVDEF